MDYSLGQPVVWSAHPGVTRPITYAHVKVNAAPGEESFGPDDMFLLSGNIYCTTRWRSCTCPEKPGPLKANVAKRHRDGTVTLHVLKWQPLRFPSQAGPRSKVVEVRLPLDRVWPWEKE